ncbi:MAG: 2,3-bisphosphoglycerate-independent phosphoglycerate mutase [FCB group bacterium]|jgi:2,3-bisphosphoglycerate-independent phosphoglycerate mutase
METNKLILIILDGWGIGNKSKSDCISQANTPYMHSLIAKYPHSQLIACGEDVGLPEGQMGNSEVGHLNIGAGRIVYQDLVRVNKAVRTNSISQNKVLLDAYKYAKENGKNVHFIGLVSNGGVHSMDTHLYKLCDIAKDSGLENVYIHALLDGRDTDPYSGLGFIKNLMEHLKTSTGKIATVCGRYFTMDRDRRWERVKQGFELMVYGKGKPTHDVLQSIQESYNHRITDEFISPIVVLDDDNKPVGLIKLDDVVICFNFRTDRLREITIALTQQNYHEYHMHTMPLYYVTMTNYDDTFKGIRVLYDGANVKMTLGEVLSNLGKQQLRIAETEKYPHVTFFFSGGQEIKFEGEERILIQSPHVPTYDMQPEMSAYILKDAVVRELNSKKYDFICLNFANGDMVGHTGVYDAIIKAVEAVDTCLGEVVEAARANGYSAIIIADHGNADYAVNDDGTPNTAHSLNPVPCILVNDNFKTIRNGILSDVAPTILKVMGIDIPEEMSGKILVE